MGRMCSNLGCYRGNRRRGNYDGPITGDLQATSGRDGGRDQEGQTQSPRQTPRVDLTNLYELFPPPFSDFL